MYVRLKHTLSALALEAIEQPARLGVVGCLAAYCDLVATADGTRFAQPLEAVAARAVRRSAARRAGGTVSSAVTGALAWILGHGLLERRDGALILPQGFQPYFSYMDRQIHRLQAALRALSRGSAQGNQPAIMRKAAALFNHGLFFECHEFLEGIWREAPAADRGFYHGVILIAAAFYHYEKRNLHGTRVKLTQGLNYLRPYLPRSHGVRLDRWVKALHPWEERVEAGQVTGAIAPSQIPKIPLSTSRPRRNTPRRRERA